MLLAAFEVDKRDEICKAENEKVEAKSKGGIFKNVQLQADNLWSICKMSN